LIKKEISMTIQNAICDRWDAAGLDESIKDLWPGDVNGPEIMLTSSSDSRKWDGGPDNEQLPRARYCVMDQEVLELTAASRIIKTSFFIFLYSKKLSDLNGYADDVIVAFENSHLATEDPFSLDEGCVLHLDWVARQDNSRYGDVKFTELLLDVIYTMPRNYPATD